MQHSFIIRDLEGNPYFFRSYVKTPLTSQEIFNVGCINGDMDIIKLYVDNCKIKSGLQYACKYGDKHLHVVRYLIDKISHDEFKKNAHYFLKYCCARGYQINTFKIVLSFINDQYDLRDGVFYALETASKAGNVEMIEYIISGVMTKISYIMNFDLHIENACESGNIPSIKIFLKNGVTINYECIKSSIKSKNINAFIFVLDLYYKRYPFLIDLIFLRVVKNTSKYGNELMLDWLLNNNLSTSSYNDVMCEAIKGAHQYGRKEIVKHLLKKFDE